jgi:long-chain acyl-CoA synthetase
MKRTVIGMLHYASETFGDRPYLCVKGDKGYNQKSYKETEARVFAASLLGLGFERNSKVAILSEGSANWVVGEYGTLIAGCISVPLSVKLMLEEVFFRLNHSESRALLVSKNNIGKVLAMLDKVKNRRFCLIYLDDDEETLKQAAAQHNLKQGKDLFAFSRLVEEGKKVYEKKKGMIEAIEEEIGEEDVVTISYTSGTTGNPKGIMLTNKNYYSNCSDAVNMFDVPPDYSTLLLLPCDHSFAHTVGLYAALLRGITLYFVDSRGGGVAALRNIPINLKEASPVFLLTVPALSGNFVKKIAAGIEEKGKLLFCIFKAGMRAGLRFYGDCFRKPPLFRRIVNFPMYKFADLLIFKKVRSMFGSRIEFCVGGGAFLDIKQQEFFKSLGVPVSQGYGLTEAAPVISSNTPKLHRLGTSGKTAPSVTCRIVKEKGGDAAVGEKGQVVIRGENVMKGYFKNEEATKEALRDGWLYTGDLGHLDEDGFLCVVGREKALLISEDGEKYSPEEIEEAIISTSDLVSQVMIYNDHRRYTSALVVLDTDRRKDLVAHRKVFGRRFVPKARTGVLLRVQERRDLRVEISRQVDTLHVSGAARAVLRTKPNAQLDDEDGPVQDNRALRRPHRVQVLTGGRQV